MLRSGGAVQGLIRARFTTAAAERGAKKRCDGIDHASRDRLQARRRLAKKRCVGVDDVRRGRLRTRHRLIKRVSKNRLPPTGTARHGSLPIVMESDSDVPLSNYAGINYLRKEIIRLVKLVAGKTVRVQQSASSPAAAGRRLIPGS